MDKTAIKNFAIEARKILMKTAINKAGFYGITNDGISEPIQKGPDFEIYKTVAGTENRIFGSDIKRRRNLVEAINGKGFDEVIEETAYTWFNRIIAVRFMEVNDYLPTRTRVLSSEAGNNTPDIVSQYLDVNLNMSEDEIENVRTSIENNRYDDAFQFLFVKQCNELNDILPGLFEKTDDYMELLLDISYTSDGVARMLVDEVEEENFNVEKEGQVEIIGWLYQYYNTELKDDTFAKLKKNVKITKERIPAATQLFTPDWIVRYMVENSLGRVWIDHLRALDETADEKKLAESFGWKYYLPEAEQEPEVVSELVKIRSERKDLKPQDITCIDPCMGSGHILVYMFDVLLQIYESEGISVRDAVFDILEKNIHGLDIDIRAYQLSYFALMMKGRGAAGRRFFRGVEAEDGSDRPIALNVYVIDESNDIDRSALSFLGKGMLEIEKNTAEAQVNGLLDEMTDAKEYGSIINVTECDWELVDRYLNSISADGQLTLGFVEAENEIKKIRKSVNIGYLLSQEYEVVVTNPPYMGNRNMSTKLSEYIKKHYQDYKFDLFSVFINRCTQMNSQKGYSGFLSPYVWMFIKSYYELRNYIYKLHPIRSLIQFEYSAFEEATVPICTFVLGGSVNGIKGNYIRLSDYVGGMEIQRIKTIEAINNTNCGFYYEAASTNYTLIPESPVAYWMSESFIRSFANTKLGDIADSKQGLATADNNRFLRLWFEVLNDKICFTARNIEESINSGCKWFPYNKGGEFRKWYGNNDYLVNWETDGKEIRNFKDEKGAIRSRPQNTGYYFRESGTWSDITSSTNAFRYKPAGGLFDIAGMSFFSDDNLFYLIALCNTKIVMNYLKILAPTMHCQCGDVANIPVIIEYEKKDVIDSIVQNNINISKNDWDSFETSWDFERHPLISVISKNRAFFDDIDDIDLAECFACWENECNERFEQLKKNEEELNQIFIDIYGLQDELTPEVEDKDVTVRKADLSRDIKSLISFAVGCMFGRYSLDEMGLVYAGGEFDSSKYTTFSVDDDAIIPITDEEYFDDDIVTRFVEFVRTVYGNKSLENNLDFIAKALGNKGNTSREVIRNYFLNDFFKDHCSTYSVTGSGKRPIYWLFDSGKQNGFKCLIYLHRYNQDTVGLIRSMYFRKTQDAIENAMRNAEYVINTSSSAVERANATRKRDKYIKQLNEMRPYYQALTHIALQRIPMDLDDGVKKNYQLFQGVEISGEGTKNQKIDLLAKI
ncbi:Methyltransferase domain-containing protein [Lachnospiraceae bacterium]|nr:Methyltransferase domain-containing protein [Lachnospiraceae bacterium]